MDYCTTWWLVGLAIGLAPLAVAFLLTVLVARSVARLWVGLLLAFVVAAPVLVVGRVASLVLWNGVAPAPSVCD